MRSKFRLYFIGVLMGIADLIPGVSGGTIAFVCGIYEELLASIQTLRIQNFRKIAWPFLLTLGGGMATSILLFSKLFYFLMLDYKAPLYGFFFGVIAASTLTCAKEAKMKKPIDFLPLVGGAVLSYLLTIIPAQLFFGSGFWGILFAGIVGTAAMLLPGISGSFVLQVIGVYPLVLYALTTPTAASSLKLLIAMGIGIAIGFAIFSRAISSLLAKFRKLSLSCLVGFMAGSIKALWPFGEGIFLLPLIFAIVGFSLIICLEIRMKRLRKARGAN
jgi:putative membrane protein